MFEDRTYENIHAEVLAEAEELDVDTRPGSIIFDATSFSCFKLAEYYSDVEPILQLVLLSTAAEEYLDEKGAEYKVYRNPATPAKYVFEYEGVAPLPGERFFTDGLYFILRLGPSNALYLEAIEAGTASNSILPGTSAVPMNTVPGLTAAAFGELLEPGAAIESDKDYRARIAGKIGGPAESGNRQHYKTWCEEDPGVGRARIIPLWAGENTVKGSLISPEGTPVTTTVVDRVQEYIDPGSTGLGNGAAPIGAHFTAVAAEALSIEVAFTVTLAAGATLTQVEEMAAAVLMAYFREIALYTPEKEPMIVRITTVGSLIHALAPVLDYSDLKLNGATGNVAIADTQVPVLKEGVVNASV